MRVEWGGVRNEREDCQKRDRDGEREIRLICMNEWRNVGVYVKRFSFIII
jgi:hypothetical protein